MMSPDMMTEKIQATRSVPSSQLRPDHDLTLTRPHTRRATKIGLITKKAMHAAWTWEALLSPATISDAIATGCWNDGQKRNPALVRL